jgi:hypothetical protein
MFDFIELKILYLVFHLIGIALGVGGVYASGFIFWSSIQDGKLSADEIRFLKLASKMIWMGGAMLIASGILLFSLDVTHYLASSKFLAKMTIVVIIFVNGFFYHISHIPKFVQEVGESFTFKKHRMLFVSGAVSFVSWTFALVLGVFPSIPYSYATIMAFYLALTLGAILSVFLLKNKGILK